MRRLAVLLVLVAGAATAGVLLESRVDHSGDIYQFDVTVLLDAPADGLRALLTDFEHLDRINDSIRESRLLGMVGPGRYRVFMDSYLCVAMFCKAFVSVQDVQALPDGRLRAEVVPALSDFRSGRAEWSFAEGGDGTRMRFVLALEPDFWVPPLIGPWLIRYALRREALKAIDNLERLARDK